MSTILIVEDEPKMSRLLELNLAEEGYATLAAPDAETGLRLLRQEKVDLVLTDLKLPRMDGLEFLQAVKRSNAHLPVILMTAFGTVETAINAMKAGASDYVLKPFSMEEIKLLISKELDVRRLREENRDLREALGERYRFENIVAKSAKIGSAGHRRSRGPHQFHGASGRGKRRRQGHDRARHPSTLAARLRPLHQDQLHRHPRKSAGERIIWIREGSVYGRDDGEARQVRTGRQGHDLSGRNRGRAGSDPGEALARAAGARV